MCFNSHVVLYAGMSVMFFFFFKQKTAYEMRISDWSSDVCSSDLIEGSPGGASGGPAGTSTRGRTNATWESSSVASALSSGAAQPVPNSVSANSSDRRDRKSVV